MTTQTFGESFLTATAGTLTGRRLSLRGEPKIKNLGGKLTPTANIDGTMAREFEPALVQIDVTFERPETPLSREDLLGFHDLVLTETLAGRVHYIMGASFGGEMDDSAKTGEISGLAIHCAKSNYNAVRS